MNRPFHALLIITILLLSACSTNPVTGKRDFVLMSEEQEIELGRQYSAKVIQESPPYEDAALSDLVQRIGDRLAANSHRKDLIYRFTVLDSAAVNAFALPGGYIYITRGMLAYLNSEAELAAVLGHEIGHVTARHSVRQHSTATATGIVGAVISAASGVQGIDTLADLAGTAFVRGYGREHELEADRLGAEYLARSGYDPEAMLQVVGVLKNQELFEVAVAKEEDREPNVYHGLFSTHPDNDARFQEVVAAAKTYKTSNTTRIERESFLQSIDGLTFGASAREGIVRGNRFYHQPLDFSVTFPAQWRIDNQPDRIVAEPRSNDGIVQVTMTDLNKRISPQQFMQERMKLKSMRDGRAFTVNGMEAYTAIADAKTPWGSRPVRYAVVYKGTSAFVFAGTAKVRDKVEEYGAAALQTANSLQALDGEGLKLAEEKQLRVIRAARGSSFSGLATGSPLANYPEQQLRLLNNQYPDGEPLPGQLLKVVR